MELQASNKRASWYYELLNEKDVTTYHESTENEAVHHLFVVTLKNRDRMIEQLSNTGIPTGIHYPIPIHKHECFADYSFTQGKYFPVAEEQSSQLLSLPMHPNLKESEVEMVCETIKTLI